jgi:hypothetical protein
MNLGLQGCKLLQDLIHSPSWYLEEERLVTFDLSSSRNPSSLYSVFEFLCPGDLLVTCYWEYYLANVPLLHHFVLSLCTSISVLFCYSAFLNLLNWVGR